MSVKLNKYAAIILAAGDSSRLGQPKQLLNINGNTLLNYSIQKVKEAGVQNIYTVLGANSTQIIPTLTPSSCVIINNNWKKGMGASIALAIKELYTYKYDGVVILLSDQIYFEHVNITNLIEAKKNSSKGIIVSKYKEGQGPPVFFDKKYFNELTKLNDDNGAKSIIKSNIIDVSYVDFENGHIDIDTPEDVIKLL